MTWWTMSRWTHEEEQIISDKIKEGFTHRQISEILQAEGFERSCDSIKKYCSLRGVRRFTGNEPTLTSTGTTSTATSVFSAVGGTETLQGVSVEPFNQPSNHRVLVIGDIHAPFEHRYYLDFLVETYNEWKCNTVVCVGDEADFHAFSRYPTDPNGHSPGRELELAIEHLKPYYEAFPNVKVCTSNHTVRPLKKGFEAGIPSAFFKSYQQFLHAPEGWEWKSTFEIDGVLYHHGEGYSGALGHHKAALNAMKSTVIGHIHSHGGVSYIQTEFNRIFGMNVGCGVDIEAYAFAYGRNCAFKPTLGAGVVIDGKEAYFVPMLGY